MRPYKRNTRRLATATLTGSLLLSSSFGLLGCLRTSASGPFPAETQPATQSVQEAVDRPAAASTQPLESTGATTDATFISRIDAVESTQGVRIVLNSNGRLPYQVFGLDTPPRLLLTFPSARLEPAVQPKIVDLPGVSGLFPMAEGEQGSRLEVFLQGQRAYRVQERPDGLDLTILGSVQHPSAAAEEAAPQQGRPVPGGRHLDAFHITNTTSGTRIRLSGVGPVPDPKSFRLHQPPQLIFDFIGVSGPASSQDLELSSGEIKAVHLAAEPQKTRLVVALNDPAIGFRIDRDEGLPVISLTSTHPGTLPLTTIPQVEAVEFNQAGRTGVVTLQTNRDDILLDTHREGQRLRVTLKETRLAESLSHDGTGGQRQDVQSFGGPIQTIDTYEEGADTQVAIAFSAMEDQHEIIQQGKTILVQVKPSDTGDNKAPPVYSGAKVSMDFKGIDIHNALRLLADINHLNLLVSDAVRGTVTMRLLEVPWDQALDLILETKGLGKVLQGNVLRVAPHAELQGIADAQLLAHESKQKLEPIVTELIPVSFAKASEIRDLLMETDQRAAASGGATSGGATATRPTTAASSGSSPQSNREAGRNPRMLSASGSVSVDQRTNTLIVKDMAANLAKIREMVAKLDKPIPQVLIEARIVEVGRDSSMGLGINWGLNYKGSVDAPLGLSNSASNAYAVQQNVTRTTARRPMMTGGGPTYNVGGQLPTGVTSNLGIHLGSLSPLLDLDIELGALEVNGKARTISSPRVLTTNNKEASISQGIRQPYPTESESGGTTYQYIDAALSLKVTPHVTANGYITLEVSAKNNSITDSATVLPALNTREVETQALVKDGQTIVLGGIFQNNQSDAQRGIPELKEIPLLGWLFKNKSTSNRQTELLVFITPRIISPS
ncbi:MAG: type IV pilus secretin PilQ [Magnetococcales bacterium]|nr:type IV pilus secretin PilQ [Magnetococcales bacterium]